jgi:hypothetical protein
MSTDKKKWFTGPGDVIVAVLLVVGIFLTMKSCVAESDGGFSAPRYDSIQNAPRR